MELCASAFARRACADLKRAAVVNACRSLLIAQKTVDAAQCAPSQSLPAGVARMERSEIRVPHPSASAVRDGCG